MKKLILTYTIPTLCGVAVSAALIALLALCSYVLGFRRDMAGGMALTAFAAGCFVSGLLCGLIKRRGGIAAGAVCAAAMLALTAAVSLLTGNFTGTELAGRSLCALAAACTGSVIGVNRERD
ncbi:MAG: TIGR04086 family membrane protein [Ruminiclostridium sp.]|nr:TIGR04086 family membrane protein [Ruminiclostridium sp.]